MEDSVQPVKIEPKKTKTPSKKKKPAPKAAAKAPKPSQNHVSSAKKKPKAPTSRVSPQHQPRLNPFDAESDEEVKVNSRNPFDDPPNPFLQSTNDTNPFHNGPTNPFDDEKEEVVISGDDNPFANMNGVVGHETPDEKSSDLNYEVRPSFSFIFVILMRFHR